MGDGGGIYGFWLYREINIILTILYPWDRLKNLHETLDIKTNRRLSHREIVSWVCRRPLSSRLRGHVEPVADFAPDPPLPRSESRLSCVAEPYLRSQIEANEHRLALSQHFL